MFPRLNSFRTSSSGNRASIGVGGFTVIIADSVVR
jgi:hypothetical protein